MLALLIKCLKVALDWHSDGNEIEPESNDMNLMQFGLSDVLDGDIGNQKLKVVNHLAGEDCALNLAVRAQRISLPWCMGKCLFIAAECAECFSPESYAYFCSTWSSPTAPEFCVSHCIPEQDHIRDQTLNPTAYTSLA